MKIKLVFDISCQVLQISVLVILDMFGITQRMKGSCDGSVFLVWFGGCPRLQVGCLFSVSSNQIWICFQKSCHGYPTHTCLAGLMLCVRVSRVQGACLFLIDPRLSQWMKFKFYLTFPAKYSVSHVNMSRNRSPSISNPGLRLQIDLSWKRKSCSLM